MSVKLQLKFVVYWSDSFGCMHYLREARPGIFRWNLSYDQAVRFNVREIAQTYCNRWGGTGLILVFSESSGFFGGVQQEVAEQSLFKLSGKLERRK